MASQLCGAEKRFIGTFTRHRVAVKKMNYGGEERLIMVIYDFSIRKEVYLSIISMNRPW
nr:hypothetical protein [Candidatus Freyarchaeota archaeon]